MKDIEVGEYVRLARNQGINKIIDIHDKKYELETDITNKWREFTCILEEYQLKDEIINHSKQLIELIEVKDLVCFKNKLQNSLENEEMIIHIFDNDTLEEVKQAIEKGEIELLEILTHEQFEANCYKVEEEQWD